MRESRAFPDVRKVNDNHTEKKRRANFLDKHFALPQNAIGRLEMIDAMDDGIKRGRQATKQLTERRRNRKKEKQRDCERDIKSQRVTGDEKPTKFNDKDEKDSEDNVYGVDGRCEYVLNIIHNLHSMLI